MRHRLFVLLVAAVLGGLVLGGFQIGPTAARGPGGTMSSELVVDGGRSGWGPTQGRRGQRPTRSREDDTPKERDNGDATVHVARSGREVEELRPLWERLQNGCLTSDIDHFLTYMQHAPGAVRPHVLLVEDGGLSTLVVARLEDGRLAARLGYKTLFSTRMRTLTVAYGGVLGHLDERRAQVVLQALAGSLDPGDADVVRLRGLDVAGSLHATATGEASWLRRERPAHALVHWRSALPGTLEEFLAPRKKKVRWQARKDLASLGETYGDALEVRVFRRPSELHRLFRDSEVVHRKTYQSALGVGFSTGDLHRRLTELAMARGWFRGYVLYLGGQPVAFWHGNAYHGTFGLGATGYDPAYAGDRPGGFLLMRLIEDLCADDAIHTLDFGFGDATYKRQLGDESRLEEDVAVFAPTAKAVAVNLARTTLHSATGVARRALARSGRLARAKKRWRGQLAGGDEG